MKVSKVYIKNFRSISETSFNLSNKVTAIAGGNESGKSNALKAIERFLSGDDLMDADKYQLSDEPTIIEMTFNKFNDEEKENISLVLRKKETEEVTIRRTENTYTVVDDLLQLAIDEEKKEKENANNDKGDGEENGEESGIEEDGGEIEGVDETKSDDEVASEEKADELPETVEEIANYIFQYAPECELISDVSSLITGDNIIIEKIFADKYESIDEENKYLTIRSLLEIGDVTKKDLLELKIDKRIQILRKKSSIIAKKIKSAWSQEDVKLQLVADNTSLVIHFRDGKNIPESDREDDTKWIWTLPENRSFGFRWYVTFYAKYLSRIQNTNDEDIVFLIDDAGLGLNKAAQIDLLGEFNKIASNLDKNLQTSKQVIYVSHSKYMFDWDMRKQILVANKQNGEGTIISDFWWEKFSKNNLPAPLDELGVNWLEDLLQEKNLIVEGHSDGYIINELLTMFSDKIEMEDILCGFKIIPGNGIPSQFDIAELCAFDKKKFLLIFDSDDAGKDGTKGASKPENNYSSKEIAMLTNSPIDDVRYITIEDFLPLEKLTSFLDKKGENYFKDKWQKIIRLHKPDVIELGVIGAIEKRLKKNDFTEKEIASFLKSKYFFVLDTVKDMTIADLDENQKTAIVNFFTNLNTELKKISKE